MKTKEEIIKISEPSWQKINSELENGVNPFPYQFGFIAGYRHLESETQLLTEQMECVKEKNLELQEEVAAKEKELSELKSKTHAQIVELKEIRNNSKLWKSGGIGGQDEYAGLPPFVRRIDSIIKALTPTSN